jgi:hypothetical protein|tara:strand:+ start:3552 stop:3815 length:264 start_codon:yes stop_codon:yes gene_type:complete
MKLANTKNGKIVKEGDFFYLEKTYKHMGELLKEEESIIEKIEENNFVYLDNTVSICQNPDYDLDRLYKKRSSRVQFKNTFKLIHIGF